MNVLVVGLGRTGLAAANRLSGLGADVTVTDTASEDNLKPQIASLSGDVKKIALGGYGRVLEVMFDLVVASPGVWWDDELLENFRKKGIEVVSEIELAYRLAPRKWIGITGTNGKTTTTSLVGAMLREAGIPSAVCGNIGNPAIGEDAAFKEETIVMAEISSFQLEGVTNFAPWISAILNIAPDHLDRHVSMENYASIKSLIFARQKPSDVCVLNMDDPITAGIGNGVCCRVAGFSSKRPLDDGAFLDSGSIVISKGGSRVEIGDAGRMKIKGLANIENALAACAIADAAGAGPEQIARALFGFSAIPNRMEPVAELNGVTYINDSKGTNVSATLKALDGLDSPVILIMGGRDKDGDFAKLADVIMRNGIPVYLIGEAAPKIAAALKGHKKVYMEKNLDKAVRTAAAEAEPGHTVLFSPACASFDMFKNYEERGERFRQAVAAMKPGKGAVNA
ncbi:MAG: UDP-N-acetylmuramoylalanine--D-glutamate ligase [bacterium]|nr:MAG: UDP-N-acetylmuramoylalanine--D-glutamate ligase [bacterium]